MGAERSLHADGFLKPLPSDNTPLYGGSALYERQCIQRFKSVIDFLKGKELTRTTGAVVGIDDCDNYTATSGSTRVEGYQG